jgi:hypothetical protein
MELPVGRSLVQFQMVSLEFFIDIILPVALQPWDRLTEIFSVGKGGRCVGLTTLPPCPDCHEIWEPQPPGLSRLVTRIVFTAYLMKKLSKSVERLNLGFDVSLSDTCTLSKAYLIL